MAASTRPGTDKVQRVKDIFKRYDRDGDGFISCAELQAVLKALGNFRDQDIGAIFSRIDANGDGKLQFAEFVDWLVCDQVSGHDARARVVLAPSDDDGLAGAFANFCGTGHADMDCKTFTKLCKDVRLIDRHLSVTDVDLIFTKIVPKGKRRIGLSEFEQGLGIVAERKRLALDDVRSLIIEAPSPILTGTKADAVKFHDDRRRYTGTQRATIGVHPQHVEVVANLGTGRRRTEMHPALSNYSAPQRQVSPLWGASAQTPKDVFYAFCGPGVGDLDGGGFAKLCRDCRLVGGGLAAGDIDIIFLRVALRGQRRIGFKQFEEALSMIADKKETTHEAIEEAILQAAASADGHNAA